jgi:hypothetical protein
MKKLTLVVTAVVLALAGPSALVAQQAPPDVSGIWNLQATAAFGDGAVPCVYAGTMDLIQDGSGLSGTGAMTLNSGPVACPVDPTASLTGTLLGNSFKMGFGSGQSGDATFTGDVSPDGRSIEGDLTVVAGPFVGLIGTWSAARPGDTVEIPTLGTVGLALLALLLMAAGLWVFRRRGRVDPTTTAFG